MRIWHTFYKKSSLCGLGYWKPPFLLIFSNENINKYNIIKYNTSFYFLSFSISHFSWLNELFFHFSISTFLHVSLLDSLLRLWLEVTVYRDVLARRFYAIQICVPNCYDIFVLSRRLNSAEIYISCSVHKCGWHSRTCTCIDCWRHCWTPRDEDQNLQTQKFNLRQKLRYNNFGQNITYKSKVHISTDKMKYQYR